MERLPIPILQSLRQLNKNPLKVYLDVFRVLLELELELGPDRGYLNVLELLLLVVGLLGDRVGQDKEVQVQEEEEELVMEQEERGVLRRRRRRGMSIDHMR